jgi:hypothetical protein
MSLAAHGSGSALAITTTILAGVLVLAAISVGLQLAQTVPRRISVAEGRG